jgi:hypothetical protein
MAADTISMIKLKQLFLLHQNGESLRNIARVIGISRNTVKKYIRLAKLKGTELQDLVQQEDYELEKLFAEPAIESRDRVLDLEPFYPYLDNALKDINRALPLLNSAAPALPLGPNQDMIFQGDMGQWTSFANTLELRAYLRLTKKDPTTAKAGIQALYATNPAFLTEDATITYTSTGGNQNPFYNEAVALATQNVAASSTIVNAFTKNNDPRLGKFFVLLSSTPPSDSLQSIPQGSYNQNTGKHVCAPSALVGGNLYDPKSALAPVKLISAAESYFLQAEAVARGYTTTGGSAATLYVQGITASFTATGAGDPTTYIATAQDGMAAFTGATTPEAKVRAIITQKYYAMCGFQGFEAWTEWRRTGYPKNFFVQPISSLIASGQMPMRMLYPNSELISNANYPGTAPINTPVWWGGM